MELCSKCSDIIMLCNEAAFLPHSQIEIMSNGWKTGGLINEDTRFEGRKPQVWPHDPVLTSPMIIKY